MYGSTKMISAERRTLQQCCNLNIHTQATYACKVQTTSKFKKILVKTMLKLWLKYNLDLEFCLKMAAS